MIDFLPPPVTENKEDEIRPLTLDEIKEYCGPKYQERGVALPDPAMSTFMGVFRGGKIVAALGLQMKLHAEPLMIDEGHSAVLTPLVKALERYILEKAGPQWVFLFAPAGRVAQLAQTMGMQLEPWVVLSKLVLPEAPPKPVLFDLEDAPGETEVVQ